MWAIPKPDQDKETVTQQLVDSKILVIDSNSHLLERIRFSHGVKIVAWTFWKQNE